MELLEKVTRFVPNLDAIQEYIISGVKKGLQEKDLDINYFEFKATPILLKSDTQIKVAYETIYWDEVEFIGIESEEEIKESLDGLILEIVTQLKLDMDEDLGTMKENVDESLKKLETYLKQNSDLGFRLELREDNKGWEIYKLDDDKNIIVFGTIFLNGRYVVENIYDIDLVSVIAEYSYDLKLLSETTVK